MRHLGVTTLASLLLLTGCGASATEKAAAIGLEEDRVRVEGAAVEVASALEEATLEVPDEAVGRYRDCRGGTASGVDYTVTLVLAGADPTPVVDALLAADWEQAPVARGAGDLGSLTMGDLGLALSRPASAPDSIAVGVTGECVEAEPGQTAELQREDHAVDLD